VPRSVAVDLDRQGAGGRRQIETGEQLVRMVVDLPRWDGLLHASRADPAVPGTLTRRLPRTHMYP
jgi:hypothetical protein